MADPLPGDIIPARTRKRILDPADTHDDDNNARRPSIYTEWQDTLKNMCVPYKKGFTRQSEDINQSLADNLEDSLSGLGVDISTVPYNMSEAIMALPSLPLFKQETSSTCMLDKPVVSPINSLDDTSQSNTNSLFKLLSVESLVHSPSSSLDQMLQAPLSPPCSSFQCHPSATHLFNTSHELTLNHAVNNSHIDINNLTHEIEHLDERYQYILGAATSIATKVNEESLSYLNQGHSYEIKVKKLGDLTRFQGTLYHTLLRICFHERRLQSMEKEQLQTWHQMRPGERILEIDTPLSYGISEVIQDLSTLNVCEFDWDPTKEVGVYVKVNCISTEFTPKKHGGEKGVPFRIQIETYNQSESPRELLHVCACQIKVFKLKGADRKHKQDRERISKRPQVEQERYQKSYECTILSELSSECVYIPCDDSEGIGGLPPNLSPTPPPPIFRCISPKLDIIASLPPPAPPSTSQEPKDDVDEDNESMYYGKLLLTNASTIQTQMWLTVNRFSKYITTFSNFAGADLLRLSRAELIDICELADGIRLYNSLHSRNSLARLTLYVRVDNGQLYNAMYLENVTCSEFVNKVSALINISPDSIHDVYLQGPSGIHILVNDEVINNLKNESTMSVEVLEDNARIKYRLLIRIVLPVKREQTSPT